MKRQIERQLLAWKNRAGRKPLVLRGVRQVGKTYCVRELGRQQFKNAATFDLEQERSCHRVFAGDLNARRMLADLEVLRSQRIVPGETLLFLDEIQACPRALMALRYFHEEIPELHVIAAGSLLEFALQDLPFPVGRVEFLWLYPMAFAEFLWATGQELLDEQRPHLDTTAPIRASAHERLRDELRRYLVVGGMPEAVQTWVETNSWVEVSRVHRNLAQSYLEDFAKYNPRADREVLAQVFARVPAEVGRQTKYTALVPDRRVEVTKRALRILEQTLVLHRVTAAAAHGLPLGAALSEKVFKCVLCDSGLLCHLTGLNAAQLAGPKDMLDVFRGSLAEQFVGQELLAERGGSEQNRLYYWARAARGSSAEVDYLLARQGRIWAIEVKSGPASRRRSLQLFLREHLHAGGGLVLHDGNVADLPAERLRFLPLYTRLAEPQP